MRFIQYDAAIGEIYVANPPVPWLPRTKTVGSYAANAFGLYDMHGNVWEWCQDWYDAYPTGTAVDPAGPAAGSFRVLRGGSWANEGNRCRAAVREKLAPADKNEATGFRVVVAPVQP